jgi:carbon storage regulator
MLVLKRHIDERIVIGDDIVIQVVRIQGGEGGSVRLGITAPPEVRIDREEVRRRIERRQRREGGVA